MSVEYVLLDPQTLEPSETGIIYRKTSFSLEAVNETKTETIRIDNETVEDVTYTFDLELGEYVEQSREQRAELLPPQPESETEKIAKLEAENAILKERDAQIQSDINAIMDALLG